MEWIALAAAVLLLACTVVSLVRRRWPAPYAPGDPRSLHVATPNTTPDRCSLCGAPLDEADSRVCVECWGWSER